MIDERLRRTSGLTPAVRLGDHLLMSKPLACMTAFWTL
jgi:hypothetical protein